MANDKMEYDHPNFQITHQVNRSGTQMGVSAVDTIIFRARNKAIANYIHLRLASAASAPAGSLCVARIRDYPSNTSIQTIAVTTFVSATSAGTAVEVTLSTNNTLTSIKDVIALRWTGGGDKGKFDVCLEWQYLPSFSAIR